MGFSFVSWIVMMSIFVLSVRFFSSYYQHISLLQLCRPFIALLMLLIVVEPHIIAIRLIYDI